MISSILETIQNALIAYAPGSKLDVVAGIKSIELCPDTEAIDEVVITLEHGARYSIRVNRISL